MKRIGYITERMYIVDGHVLWGSEKHLYEEQKRKRRNSNIMAVVSLVIASILAFAAFVLTSTLWTYDFAANPEWVKVLDRYEGMKFSHYGYNELCKAMAFLGVLCLCNYLACFAFRRGQIRPVWGLLYFVSLIAGVAIFWFWNVQTFAEGDMAAWITMITKMETPAVIYLLGAVFAVFSLIVFFAARFSGDFYEIDEGKIHGNVCICYIGLTLTNIAFLVVAFLWFLIKEFGRFLRSSLAGDVKGIDY